MLTQLTISFDLLSMQPHDAQSNFDKSSLTKEKESVGFVFVGMSQANTLSYAHQGKDNTIDCMDNTQHGCIPTYQM